MSQPVTIEGKAAVNGKPVSRAEATKAAAAVLAASRSAIIAVSGTDVAGARAAVALARAIGGSIDHPDAHAVFANLEVMRRAGWIITTPLQARSRADTVLLVGGGLLQAWPDMPSRLGLDAAPTLAGGTRRVFHLCPGSDGIRLPVAAVIDGVARQASGSGDDPTVLLTLAALRAVAAGRPTSLDAATSAPLRRLATALAEARFGVAVWSSATLETLVIEMLCGLIDDLNRKTRFAGLPLAAPNGADCVLQAATWASGFPIRTGFAGGEPMHDPWRFDGPRQIARGEADAAVWISASSRTPPPWNNAVPTIALVPACSGFQADPAVMLEVGWPGRDHDAMVFDPALGTIAFAAATAPRTIASVADTLAAIAAALASC